MDFKQLMLALSLPMALAACTAPPSVKSDENLVGSPLAGVSSLAKSDGTDSEQVAIFDETIRKIHQFHLSDMAYQKSYEVPNKDGKHTVLSHDQGNYVIDLSDKYLTIFSKTGLVQRNPLTLQGKPISAAFRSDLNLLVIYDDLNSVGILQMNSQGLVQDSWLGGPYLGTSKTISAGDLLENGNLILALDDGSIAVADVAQTLAQQKWILSTSFASGLTTHITWAAPVAGNPKQVFVKAGSQLALFDLAAHTQLDSKDLSGKTYEKLSKSMDGHVVVRNDNSPNEIQLYYAQGSLIQSRSLNRQAQHLMSSHLNLKLDRWSFVEMSDQGNVIYLDNDIDSSKRGRSLKMLRPSDMAALQKTAVVDDAQALLSPSYIFALFPSELGYAARFDIQTGERKEAKFFNAGNLKN